MFPLRWLSPALLFCAATLFAAPPPAPSGTGQPLFDGTTLAGWEATAPELWRVAEGALTGGNGQKVPRNEFLCTTGEYGDFVLRLRIKLSGDAATGMLNSGVQIRSKRLPGSHEVSGYQCDYGEPSWYGAIYDEGRRNRLLIPSDMEALRPALHVGDWNEYVIRAEGPRIQTWINGVPAADYTEAEANIPQQGIIGIQLHSGGVAQVQVKDVVLEALAPAGPRTPEEERASFTVPPGFEVELVAAEAPGIGKFVAVDWDQQGRLWTMTALEYPVDGNESPAVAKALYEAPGKDKVLVFDRTDGPGPFTPRVFADGLAIPLGMMPYGRGVFVQHGPIIRYLEDTDGDGRADQNTPLLTGFGVQDSHLFMHQFTRMPGGWIWAAQGAFNKGTVKTTKGEETDFPSTRMARFRPDGSQFEILSTGPCNIWGLAVLPTGEMFIQEANDFGYPAMPFHIGGNYPGCADRLFKSYAPPFPGTAQDFRMGGTGLSGLALADAEGGFPKPYGGTMFVANPITRQLQRLTVEREGPRWKVRKEEDFLNSTDPMFRPVGMAFGPDGALYVVDWYNKVISHNEVPRNHPDRDKVRGRIWRIWHQDQKRTAAPNFATASAEVLVAALHGPSQAQMRLAWQALVDRKLTETVPALKGLVQQGCLPALWALEGLGAATPDFVQPLLQNEDRNVRREAMQVLGRSGLAAEPLLAVIAPLAEDADPEVRAEVIRTASGLHTAGASNLNVGVGRAVLAPGAVELLVKMGRPSLAEPMEPSTRDKKPVRVREAYEREFERYLVREALELNQPALEQWLSSAAAEPTPVENRLLAVLALEPRRSAGLLAKILGGAGRPANDEELLRLAQFPGEPGVLPALQALLQTPEMASATLEGLLRQRTRFDATKLAEVFTATATTLLDGDKGAQALALELTSGFELKAMGPVLLARLKNANGTAAMLRTLGDLRTEEVEFFAGLLYRNGGPSPQGRELFPEALEALAKSSSPSAPRLTLEYWSSATPVQRRTILAQLSGTPAGAKALTKSLTEDKIPLADIDGATMDRLQTLLRDEPAWQALQPKLQAGLQPVLHLAGGWAEPPGLTLSGPFTVETWVRLEPGISNADGILGAPGVVDMNFYNGQFRVWVGGGLNDIVTARKKIVAENWTHVAVTRDAEGRFRLYQDGELDTQSNRSAPQSFPNLRIGWAQGKGGCAGNLAEFRVWQGARTAAEIRANFDRALAPEAKPAGLLLHASGEGWGKLQGEAHLLRLSDKPPLLTTAEADALEARYAHYRKLAEKPGGRLEQGKSTAAVCMACHLMQGQGGNIGPNLSGVGAMGLEGILRNILTPNAAMEAGYRIYRVELRTGELLDSFYVSEDAQALVVRVPGGPERRLPKADVREAKFIRRSLMPEGLLETMTPEQVTDLFTFLLSLKG